MDKKDMAAQIAAWKKKHGDVFAYAFQVRMAEWVENERVRRYAPSTA